MTSKIKFDVIVAIDEEGGIGKGMHIPWSCPEDLKNFKAKTMDSVVIVGKNTAITLPELKGRTVYCITRNFDWARVEDEKNKLQRFEKFSTIEQALEEAGKQNKKIFIAGGSMTYHHVFKYLKDRIDTLYLTRIHGRHGCNIFFGEDVSDFVVNVHTKGLTCDMYEMQRVCDGEKQYLELAKKIVEKGDKRVGRNVHSVRSLFGEQLKFDLRNGFPLLTTKKTFFRGIVAELLFFLRGETDSKLLEEQGVNIWKGNTSREFLDSMGKTERREGLMGPMYGYQWRNFGAKYDEETASAAESGVDQLKYVIDTIKNDPTSRRILMTDFNPTQAMEGVLYPCHSLVIQFYVLDNFLDMYAYNRSQDFFLGVPFNIASSALLLSIVAKLTGLIPRYFIMGMGDVHIYEQHVIAMLTQLERIPYRFPVLSLPDIKTIGDLEGLKAEDVKVVDYQCHAAIKAEMAV